MAILVKSKTSSDNKNLWGTTWECFEDANELYGRKFECDVAAEPLTAKCRKYFTSPDILDSLIFDQAGIPPCCLIMQKSLEMFALALMR